MVKKSENLKFFWKIQKNHFFSKNLKILKIFFFADKKNAIPLVLPIEQISLQPELSSSARFRIQGGGSTSVTEEEEEKDEGQRTEILVSNFG